MHRRNAHEWLTIHRETAHEWRQHRGPQPAAGALAAGVLVAGVSVEDEDEDESAEPDDSCEELEDSEFDEDETVLEVLARESVA